jgi:hypothetical protein
MKTKIQFYFLMALVLLAGISCKKNEGKGGKFSISGKVYANYYNKDFTTKRYGGYIADRDVFIMYGDETINGDDTKTSYDGSFEFKYLTKGKYKVYAYSIDKNTQLKTAVIKEIELTENVNLEDIVINKADETSGSHSIRGKLFVNDYDNTFSIIEGSYYGMDEDVYLIKDGDSSYTDKVKTNYNGMYEFNGLRNGDYKVYAYSQEDKSVILSGLYVVDTDVTVSGDDIMVPDLIVKRK